MCFHLRVRDVTGNTPKDPGGRAAPDNDVLRLLQAWMRSERTFQTSRVWPLVTSVPGVTLDRTAYEVIRELNLEGQYRLSDLAAVTSMSKPHASRVVDGLVQSGLITRTTPAGDRRVTMLTLTDRGKQVAAEIQVMFMDLVVARLAHFSHNEVVTFADLYTRFADEVMRWAHEEGATGDTGGGAEDADQHEKGSA